MRSSITLPSVFHFYFLYVYILLFIFFSLFFLSSSSFFYIPSLFLFFFLCSSFFSLFFPIIATAKKKKSRKNVYISGFTAPAVDFNNSTIFDNQFMYLCCHVVGIARKGLLFHPMHIDVESMFPALIIELQRLASQRTALNKMRYQRKRMGFHYDIMEKSQISGLFLELNRI